MFHEMSITKIQQVEAQSEAKPSANRGPRVVLLNHLGRRTVTELTKETLRHWQQP